MKTFKCISKIRMITENGFKTISNNKKIYSFSTKSSQSVAVKKWTKYVEPIEEEAEKQIENIAKLGPHIIHGHIAVMPDVHLGKGATVGSVIPTKRVIIPAAVGVDIGCGMCAIKTSLKLNDIKLDNLSKIRKMIESVIPLGFDGCDDAKFKNQNLMKENLDVWNQKLKYGYEKLISIKPSLTIKKSQIEIIKNSNSINHLGSLGGGNHFIEICIDNHADQNIWIMLHSGSRGIGNAIGRTFVEIAKEDMLKHYGNIPLDKELAYLTKGTENFDHYWFAVKWAQNFASLNRQIMMNRIIKALNSSNFFPKFNYDLLAINCHHNYVDSEVHNGEELYITRKGAVSAQKGEFGIIPGSMGAKSYIVKGLGNRDSYCSCSHGAGRRLSRNQAKKVFSIEDLKLQTQGVECKKDDSVLDEIPEAYKNIDKVMESQTDLVEVYCSLKQILCVKG